MTPPRRPRCLGRPVTIARVVGLLEREDQLRLLTEVVHEAAGGRGCLVLVGGEAGIGKTSLLRGLRERVGDQATFLTGVCEPLSVPVPMGPIRELMAGAGAGDLSQSDTSDRLVLAGRLMGALESRSPVVAVVEEIHWADPLTLDLVRMLTRRVEQMRAAIVATFRDDEVAGNPALGLMLGDLASATAVRRVRLRPLSDAAVGELAAPRGLDPAELVRITGGNPFLVVEAVLTGDLGRARGSAFGTS